LFGRPFNLLILLHISNRRPVAARYGQAQVRIENERSLSCRWGQTFVIRSAIQPADSAAHIDHRSVAAKSRKRRTKV
jgi:hypothetical protein